MTPSAQPSNASNEHADASGLCTPGDGADITQILASFVTAPIPPWMEMARRLEHVQQRARPATVGAAWLARGLPTFRRIASGQYFSRSDVRTLDIWLGDPEAPHHLAVPLAVSMGAVAREVLKGGLTAAVLTSYVLVGSGLDVDWGAWRTTAPAVVTAAERFFEGRLDPAARRIFQERLVAAAIGACRARAQTDRSLLRPNTPVPLMESVVAQAWARGALSDALVPETVRSLLRTTLLRTVLNAAGGSTDAAGTTAGVEAALAELERRILRETAMQGPPDDGVPMARGRVL